MTDTSTVQPASPAVEACKRDRMKEVLAYLAVAMLFYVITVLIFVKMDQFLHDILLVIVGAILANYKEVYGFVFGSSQGSQDKTTAMAAQTAATPPTTP